VGVQGAFLEYVDSHQTHYWLRDSGCPRNLLNMPETPRQLASADCQVGVSFPNSTRARPPPGMAMFRPTCQEPPSL
jgi:hypothetical protein